jgi:hypothetical protein
MLERYFVRPATVDRIRSSWISGAIEQYVSSLAEQGYAARNVFRRVPILVQFGEFARERGATRIEALPAVVDAFVARWTEQHGVRCATTRARKKVASEARGNRCTDPVLDSARDSLTAPMARWVAGTAAAGS